MDCSLLGSFSPWDFPGKNAGVGCHFLLQGIFPTQRWKPGLLHWQADSFTPESPGVCKIRHYTYLSDQYFLKGQSWLVGWLFIFDNEYQALWKFSTCQQCKWIEFQVSRWLKKVWKWRNSILLSEVKGALAKKKSMGMKCIFDHCYGRLLT